MLKEYFLFVLLATSMLAVSCAPTTLPPPVTEPPTRSNDAIPWELLKNAAYTGILEQPVTLKDGRADYDDGGSGQPYVALIDHLIATGDLDRDGQDDAALMLVDYSSGSADFVYLVPVLNIYGEPLPLMALQLGDRTPVKSLAIADGQVVVEFLAQGPDNPDCCATTKTRKTFALQDGQLVEQKSEDLGKVSAHDLDGTDWILVNLNQDQKPVLSEPQITLHIEGGQISGSGGCNNYNASVTTASENLPQTFDVGPVAATKKACADAISNQENTYFTLLDAVTAWHYNFGYLSLTYKDGQDFGDLVFAEQGGSQPFQATTEVNTMDMSLTGNSWNWVSFTNPVEAYQVETPESYTLTFNEDGTLAIKADCNLANASYTDDNGALQISVGPSTLALCPPESRSEKFIQYLGYARRYFFQDGHLFMDMLADGGTLEFAASTP